MTPTAKARALVNSQTEIAFSARPIEEIAKAQFDNMVALAELAPDLLTIAERNQWRPIAEAPKDGSAFLTYSPPVFEEDDQVFDIAGFHIESDEFWKVGCGFQYVTHFMPLPSPPAKATLETST